jgi:hypothetical protein
MISNMPPQPCLWYIIHTISYPVDHPQIGQLTSLCLGRNNCIITGESVTPALGVTLSHPDWALVFPETGRRHWDLNVEHALVPIAYGLKLVPALVPIAFGLNPLVNTDKLRADRLLRPCAPLCHSLHVTPITASDNLRAICMEFPTLFI